jgi:hypothetical protein
VQGAISWPVSLLAASGVSGTGFDGMCSWYIASSKSSLSSTHLCDCHLALGTRADTGALPCLQ